jgi:vitamin B12 transporter
MRPTSLAALFFLAAASARAGTLTGSARTADGRPLPHVVIVARGAAGTASVVTGPEGRFRVELPAGEYALEVDTPGLVRASGATVAVADGETAAELVLGPAPVREHVVVAATRSEALASTLGVSSDVMDGDRVLAQEPTDLLHVLQQVPGVSVARTGGVGAQGSVFLRGGVSNFARVLVDGAPANEPGGAFDFGALAVLEVDRIEVVRGAASSLYGTDALAGVLHLVTRRAAPGRRPDLSLEAEGGSFDWMRYRAGTSGRSGRFDWNLGASRVTTDNEQPNNEYEQTAGAASLGAELGATSLRLAFRGETSRVGTPGQTAFARPDLDAYYERDVTVLSLEAARTSGDRVLHRLRAGHARADQPSFNPEDSGPYTPAYGDLVGPFELFDFPSENGFGNLTARASLGYQAEVRAGRRHLLTAGADVEHETGRLGAIGGPDEIEPRRTNFGAYLQDRVVLGASVFATVGGRVEHNDSYGTRAVPRGAIAWRVRGGDDATTLRASAGAGIKEPSFFESFGVSFFAEGNPDLRPERSRTFDLGVEQRLFGSRLRARATAFHHQYLDQIAFQVVDFETFQGTYVNLGESRARGVEASVEAAPVPDVTLSAQYTFTDGVVETSTSDFDPVYAEGEALLRRPRHQGALFAHARRGRVGAGVTLVLVGERVDSDFLGLGLTRNDGYARLDARAQVRVGYGLEAFVAGENLLDAEYQEVLGYPALGRSVRAGLRFRASER